MSANFVFDMPHYDGLNNARLAAIERLLEFLSKETNLETAVDVGCGIGHLAEFLHRRKLKVLALDGRPENVAEARRRFPALDFRVADAENNEIRNFGTFDFVLCAGLLYHLENPFATVRNLFAMTAKLAIVEGMCFPGSAAVFAVRDEGRSEDQGLRYVALYPTENGLIKLLYRAGFPYVYRFRTPPAHRDYKPSLSRRQTRTILVAAQMTLNVRLLELAKEPVTERDPWEVAYSPGILAARIKGLANRLRRFASSPANSAVR